MHSPFCFDCRFFVPDGRLHNDLTEEQWDEALEGECRAGLPALGPLVSDRHGDEYRHYGEWPRVLASFWCGQFQPKLPAVGERTVRTIRLAEQTEATSRAGGHGRSPSGGSEVGR